MDKNLILNEFSHALGYRETEFLEFTQVYGIKEVSLLVKEFNTIQERVYDHIWEITKPDKKLTVIEIETISEQFLRLHYEWMSQLGITAIHRWLLWMCWHEGILKIKE